MKADRMTLASLAEGFTVIGEGATLITDVTEDSRTVVPGALFVAIAGTVDDGHRYIADAVSRGAAAIAVERSEDAPPGVPCVVVPSARQALATLAARFHGTPAAQLDIVGFTGTFGKTTTSYVMQRLLEAAGRRTAVVGSLGAQFAGEAFELRGMTTPSPVLLQRTLRRMRDAGADTVVMEVTSHALQLDRVFGLRFSGAMVAAIRPGEHIDFHRTYDDYVASKRRILDYVDSGALVAHDADNRAAASIARARDDVRDVGFSLRRTPIGDAPAAHERRHTNRRDRRMLSLADASLDDRGAVFTIDGLEVRSALLGRANLRNVALALAYVRQLGLPVAVARDVLASLAPLRRRMERLDIAGRLVLDDTAGHPESFDATFEVADLLPANRIIVAYALRGSRGAEINSRNAVSLAEHAQTIGASRLIVTEAADTVRALDAVQPDEADATREAFHRRGVEATWHETMETAMRDAARASSPGDLIVLVGAQGMDAGRDMLQAALHS